MGTDLQLIRVPWEEGEWGMFALPEENRKYVSEFLSAPPSPSIRNVSVVPSSADGLARPPVGLENSRGRGRLLCFHDSFYLAGVRPRDQQLMAAHFARSVFLWMRPTNRQFLDWVEQEHPDVVIEQRAERLLASVPDAQDLATWAAPRQ
jgi:hypothetical protein